MEANDNGIYFPIYFVCNGMEMLGIIIAEDVTMLSSNFNDPGVTHSLFETPASKTGRFFSKIPEDVYKDMFVSNISFFHHKHAYDFEKFVSNGKLMDFFDILSISTDLDGRWFVSTIEAKDYPFYAV